jgi:D-3-phosphoglycerate dehydrogenase / 2-oxoglutarate reductase
VVEVAGLSVLVTCRQMQSCIEEFRERFTRHGVSLVLPPVVQQLSEGELADMIGDFDAIIAGDDPITANVLERATRLKVVAKWGIGVDGIDLPAARRLGIPVINTPAVFGDEVADVAMGYVILLARQLHRIDAGVRAGGWPKPEGLTLHGKRLGVLGFGSIGRAVAARGRGFGMEILASDLAGIPAADAIELGVRSVDESTLFAETDFLVLCSPLTADTRHIVGDENLAQMHPGSFVINVARGPLVDETALFRALSEGRLAGAALDVFEVEPLPAAAPLRAIESCIFGSHNASNTREGVLRASAQAVANTLAALGLE